MTALYNQQHALVLASASPRRVELLKQIGVEFTQAPANVNEDVHDNEQAADYVLRLAREKAFVVAFTQPDKYVLGSDTTVHINGTILGKPTDFDDFMTMMALLSGQTHEVITAVCIATIGNTGLDMSEAVVTSKVTFGELNEQQRLAYWESGEPIGKAGGYAIQGIGGQFVKHIDGSYSGIVGLPLAQTVACLQESGVINA
ncbi:MAG: Maf family protein [Glaciecola sp.]|jgi:septum formation protein|nr:Maf family protein [Glaciecola sp.]MDG1469910.1 Maf family protein [Glaciecola sp.]MDG1921334.1 Maf family protein [Glaciecola sp.]